VTLWAKVYREQTIIQQAVQEFSSARPSSVEEWTLIVTSLCKPLDLACPILLKKHLHEFTHFSRTVFQPSDFMEDVSFDRFEIEIFPEKTKN